MSKPYTSLATVGWAATIAACSGDVPMGSVSAAGATAGGGSAAVAPGSSFPEPCSDVYDPNVVPTFELELNAADLQQLEEDCANGLKEYRPATFRYGSETLDAMVRLKGNWSYRCEKKQFLISFNEVNPDGRFHGQRKLVLDAPWYDPSLVAERLASSFMRRHGAYWSCVNHARLMLNGEYYGVYANVERLDKEYLQRHFPDAEAEGNLYDGGDELKTNETLGDTSRRDALFAGGSDFTSIDELADLDEAVKVWAGSAMLPDPDSYWAGVEINYYLYDHPTRGFLWLPYDMDLTMRQGVPDQGTSTVALEVREEFTHADPFTYVNPDWGREEIYRTVLSTPSSCERFLTELRGARSVYDPALMSAEIDAWAAQIADAVAQDPNKPFETADHLQAIANLKTFMTERARFVDEWLASATCPVTDWDR